MIETKHQNISVLIVDIIENKIKNKIALSTTNVLNLIFILLNDEETNSKRGIIKSI